MMADESLIAKPRDYSDIIKLQEPGVLEDFFDEPLPFIVATVTGALAAGKSGWILSSGRMVQAMLKGRLFQQWSNFKKPDASRTTSQTRSMVFRRGSS
jgi:hypothetical protein